jgi:hypothetical protein
VVSKRGMVFVKVMAILGLSLLVAGCSRWELPPVPLNTAYNLDGTNAAEEMDGIGVDREAKRWRQSHKSKRNALASIETTGSVVNLGDQEDEQLSQIMKLKAHSPEWLALRKQIEQDRIAKNKRELARITICNC